MSRVYPRGQAAIEANLTPMIDMTFLLIVFFVLVSRISEVEMVPMDLPEPRDAATVPPPEEGRVVLNVLPGESGAAEGYRVGASQFPPTPQGREARARHLGGIFRAPGDCLVSLRADRRTAYAEIAPAIEAVSQAARTAATADTARLNLVVISEDRPSRSRP